MNEFLYKKSVTNETIGYTAFWGGKIPELVFYAPIDKIINIEKYRIKNILGRCIEIDVYIHPSYVGSLVYKSEYSYSFIEDWCSHSVITLKEMTDWKVGDGIKLVRDYFKLDNPCVDTISEKNMFISEDTNGIRYRWNPVNLTSEIL